MINVNVKCQNERYVQVYMTCATTPDGNGCDCNVTTYVSNPLSGNNMNGRPNNQPNGLNLRTGYSDFLTMEDYEERFQFAPQRGLCYLPPTAPPREGCEPVFDFQDVAKASARSKANQSLTDDILEKARKYREENGPTTYDLEGASPESREWYYTQV